MRDGDKEGVFEAIRGDGDGCFGRRGERRARDKWQKSSAKRFDFLHRPAKMGHRWRLRQPNELDAQP